MKRIAILAYACKEGAGSEPGAGYLWALAAARSAHVEIVTRPLDDVTRNSLKSAGISVHELSVAHSGRIPQLSYLRWLMLARVRLAVIHESNPLQLIHHVTYATDWLPSVNLPGVPFIWGPVGGSTGLPVALARYFSPKLRAKELARTMITRLFRAFTHLWARRNVEILLAQNLDTARRYAKLRDVEVHPNYVVKGIESSPTQRSATKQAAIVGRLIEMKGVHIAIAAMAQNVLADWTLHVVGDGPMRTALEQQCGDLGISNRVTFHGHIPRSSVSSLLRSVDCSLLLSTHDAAGWAAAESIHVGTPVVTWSHGGPAELVLKSQCGQTLVPGTKSVEDLALAIADLRVMPSRDMSDYEFESLVLKLRGWYEKAWG